MSQLLNVPINEIDVNPFRQLAIYPYVERKITALLQSYADVGMWEGIIGRKRNNRVQIAFGHHRLEAARKINMVTVPIIVRDLTDKQMLEFMGRENLEDYNADFLCMLETWEAGTKFLSSADDKSTQPTDIARLLGWLSESQDHFKLNTTARACSAANSLISGGYLSRNDLVDISVKSAREIVERAHSRMEQLEALGKRTQRPNNEIENAKKQVAKGARTTAKETREGKVTQRDLRNRVDLNTYRHHKESKKEGRTPLFAIFAKSLAEQITRWNNTDSVKEKIDEMAAAMPTLAELEDLQAIDRVVFELENACKRNNESIRKLTAKPAAVIKLRAIQQENQS